MSFKALRILPNGKPSGITGWSVVFWMLAALLAALAAKLLWTLLTPVSPIGIWAPASVEAMPTAARASIFAQVDPFNRGQAVAAAASGDVVTALPLKLFGTRMNRGSGAGTAILSGADGMQKLYRTGEEVMPGVKLAGVGFDFILLDRGGAQEKLFLDQSKPAEQVAVATAPAGDTRVSGLPGISDPPAVSAAQAANALRGAITPQMVEGKVTGLAVGAGANAGVLTQSGLQEGDIITSINGKSVSSAADAASIGAQLTPGATITVDVKRGDSTQPVTIRVPR